MTESIFDLSSSGGGDERAARRGDFRWCREGGLEPKVVRENDSWVASFAFVAAGMGVTLATELHSNIGFPGVTYKSLAGQALDVSL